MGYDGLLCYHCCECLGDGNVYHMPISYNNNKYEVQGNYCSLECMKAYNAHLNDTYKNMRFQLISKMYNLQDCNIKMAPPRESLRRFGGNLSIEEFRNNFSKESNINLPPLSYVHPDCNNISSSVNNFSWVSDSNEYERVTVNNESTNKLERKKPVKKSHSTIDSMLGIGS